MPGFRGCASLILFWVFLYGGIYIWAILPWWGGLLALAPYLLIARFALIKVLGDHRSYEGGFDNDGGFGGTMG